MLTVSLRGVVYELTTGHSGNTAIGSLYLETRADVLKLYRLSLFSEITEQVGRSYPYGTVEQPLTLVLRHPLWACLDHLPHSTPVY